MFSQVYHYTLSLAYSSITGIIDRILNSLIKFVLISSKVKTTEYLAYLAKVCFKLSLFQFEIGPNVQNKCLLVLLNTYLLEASFGCTQWHARQHSACHQMMDQACYGFAHVQCAKWMKACQVVHLQVASWLWSRVVNPYTVSCWLQKTINRKLTVNRMSYNRKLKSKWHKI